MITVIAAGKAAPGATCATWALALVWPTPVLVIDADAAGGDMAAGLLGGRIPGGQGLLSWNAAARRASAAEAAAMFAQNVVALPEAPGVWVMPGLQSAPQAAAMDVGGWERLARAAGRVDAVLGRDVLVDAGRLSAASCWPVLRAADRVLLALRPTLRSVYASEQASALLRAEMGGLLTTRLLAIGQHPYPPGQVAAQLGLELAATLPHDPAAAAALSEGATLGLRGLHRTRLLRAARTLADRLISEHSTQRLAVAR